MRSDPRVRYAAASSGQSASTTLHANGRVGTHRRRQRPDRHLIGHRRQPGARRHLPRVVLRVGQRFPHPPVHDGRRQPECAAGEGERVEEGAGRGVVTEPPRAEDARYRREQHELAHRVLSDRCAAADARPVWDGTSRSRRRRSCRAASPGRRRRPQGRCPPAAAGRCRTGRTATVIAASSVASAATTMQRRAGRREFVRANASSRIPGLRDTATIVAAPISASWRDQLRDRSCRSPR